MAGLARVQQRFNAALVTILSLAGLSRMLGTPEAAKHAAAVGHGHPFHRKFLRGDPREVRTRYVRGNYQYCMGVHERHQTTRRFQLYPGVS